MQPTPLCHSCKRHWGRSRRSLQTELLHTPAKDALCLLQPLASNSPAWSHSMDGTRNRAQDTASSPRPECPNTTSAYRHTASPEGVCKVCCLLWLLFREPCAVRTTCWRQACPGKSIATGSGGLLLAGGRGIVDRGLMAVLQDHEQPRKPHRDTTAKTLRQLQIHLGPKFL